MWRLWGLIGLLVLAGCNSMTLSPTHETSVCEPFTVTGQLVCVNEGAVIIVQAQEGVQVQLSHHNLQITMTGTLHIIFNGDDLAISNLGGRAFVSVAGMTQFISQGGILQVEGTEVAYRLVDRRILPLDNTVLHENLLMRLPIWVTVPAPVAPPPDYTPVISITPTATLVEVESDVTATPSVCQIRENWASYTISLGDTVAHIARRYQTTVTDLALGNCLTDANRIRVGQVLRVPNQATITPMFAPTGTPSAVLFRADRASIKAGECTTLRWDVLNVVAVYLDEREVVAIGIEAICPNETKRYTLRVIYPDERETSHQVEVRVE